MAEKKITWHKIAEHPDEISFNTNNISVVKVKDKTVCIGKFQTKFFAFAYKCPHAGGILAEGYIDPVGNVVCPVHRYKYDLKNGRNVSGEGYYLKTWVVELRPDGVFVGMEEGGSFWDLFQ